MASRSKPYWTICFKAESSSRRTDGQSNCASYMAPQQWPASSTSTSTNIAHTSVVWHGASGHHFSMAQWLEFGFCGYCDLVQDPTICPPGDSLPRKQWCTLNHFRTNQGHYGACRKLGGLADSDLCACGATQTMSLTVKSRPMTKLDGGLKKLHTADDESVTGWVPIARNLHRRFTKRLQDMKSLSHNERLLQLGLPSLELWRLHLDLVFCYKIVFGLVSVNLDDLSALAPFNLAHQVCAIRSMDTEWYWLYPQSSSCMRKKQSRTYGLKVQVGIVRGSFMALWLGSTGIRSTGGIFSFPRLMYLPRYSQGGRRGRR